MFGTILYNRALGELDQVDFPDVEEQTEGVLHHMEYDFSEMHNYAKMDYSLWRLIIGGDYKLSPLWKATLDVNYAYLDDQASYVYGSETGSFYVIRAGARMSF